MLRAFIKFFIQTIEKPEIVYFILKHVFSCSQYGDVMKLLTLLGNKSSKKVRLIVKIDR